MLNPWTPFELAATLLTWAAYLFTFLVAYPKIKRIRPHWEGRAELASMIPGVTILALVATLTASI